MLKRKLCTCITALRAHAFSMSDPGNVFLKPLSCSLTMQSKRCRINPLCVPFIREFELGPLPVPREQVSVRGARPGSRGVRHPLRLHLPRSFHGWKRNPETQYTHVVQGHNTRGLGQGSVPLTYTGMWFPLSAVLIAVHMHTACDAANMNQPEVTFED